MHADGVQQYQPEAWVRGKGSSGPEKEALLPGLNDPYKAAGFANDEESCLILVMGQAGFKIGSLAYVHIQYVHIGMGGLGFTANGQFFTFVVSDLEPKKVTIYGRNLLRIYHYIARRKMPWIRQADRDFRPGDGAPDDEAIILSIEVRDWKPTEQEGGKPAHAADGHQR